MKKIVMSGGLGNQMFQYALYLALKHKEKNVSLDCSLYSYVKMHNGFELDRCFGINKLENKFSRWNLLKLRLALKSKLKTFVYSDLNCYDENVFSNNSKYLNGYWQSEKYFIQIEDKIRQAFVFKDIDNTNVDIAKEVANNCSISLHIRRGDYLGINIYSGVCTESYYTKAVDLLLSRMITQENIKIYVFTDDVEFSSAFVKNIYVPCQLININKNADSYKDMYLMSQCKHNIIANSSFSWWGAWLNRNPDKIVIAPQKWFNSSEENYKDIVPENWIKI
ncbi:alpha-1,2-fucosyltransferase [Flavobacterium sp. TSSA_36]|uniref:alpha-1,2-fucosyltransferase n=1 Tax=Flavobacterium sp. TSSA_36 TaxID=3447669 RepID=UPI003F3DE4AD